MALYDREWADETDTKWRNSLRSVSLVTEVDFTDEELNHAIKFFAQQLRLNDPRLIAKNHPGIYAVAMTQLGSRSWEQKTFYQKVTDSVTAETGHFPGCRGKVEDATRYFLDVLQRFGLTRLDRDDTSMHWVAQVLFHGAVPLDHLDELLDLIKRNLRNDPSMTGESLVELLRSNPRLIDREPMALRLFLKHGREFTADYISRVIDYVYGTTNTLPAHITDRLDSYLEEDPDRALVEIPRTERPGFALTLDGSLILRIPQVSPAEGRHADWTIRYGDTTKHIRTEIPYFSGATKTDEAIFFLPRPEVRAVVFRENFRTEISLIDSGDPLLVFDEGGELVSRMQPIPPGTITVFWPAKDTTTPLLDGYPISGEHVDSPFGWRDWNALRFKVSEGSHLTFGEGSERHVQKATYRAQLELPMPIAGVFTLDGMSVYSELPTVTVPDAIPLRDWRITVTGQHQNVLFDGPPPANSFKVLSEDIEVHDKLKIVVRGPLGKGFVRTVSVATGLRVSFDPQHRNISQLRGVEPCSVKVIHDGRLTHSSLLKETKYSTTFEIKGFTLKATPPAEGYRIIMDSVDCPWLSTSQPITANEMRKAKLQVRGITTGEEVELALEGTDANDASRRLKARSGNVEFRLLDLADSAARENKGVLKLTIDGRSTEVARIHPEQLVEFGEVSRNALYFRPYASSQLTMTFNCLLQPWEPGVTVNVSPEDHCVNLPEVVCGRGPIRVTAHIVDPWVLASEEPYYRKSANSKDYDQSFDIETVSAEDHEICSILAGRSSVILQPQFPTVGRAAHIIHNKNVFDDQPDDVRNALLEVVQAQPDAAMRFIAEEVGTDEEKALSLIRSSLISQPLLPASADEVTALFASSPFLALLVDMGACIRFEDTERADFFREEFGDVLQQYWGGQFPDSRIGKWESPLLNFPKDALQTTVSIMGVVPGTLLSEDTRIIASSTVLISQAQKSTINSSWVKVVSRVVTLLTALDHQSLRRLVIDQTESELLCLPAASIGMALVARLAAHGAPAAQALYRSLARRHEELAILAPKLTLIDIIRAEAAVTGVLHP